MHSTEQVAVVGHVRHTLGGFKTGRSVGQGLGGGVVGPHHHVDHRRQRHISQERNKRLSQLGLQLGGGLFGVEISSGRHAGVGGKGETGGVDLGWGHLAR